MAPAVRSISNTNSPLSSELLLRNTNTAGPPEIILTSGPTGGLPIVGKWAGQP